MDDPTIGAVAPIRLRRSCERNRLERQFLINAYEHLVALVTPQQDDAPTAWYQKRSPAKNTTRAKLLLRIAE